MKIRIELDEALQEEEIIIRCSRLTPEVANLQEMLLKNVEKKQNIVFYKGDSRVYFPIEEIIFFETDSDGICAHTIDENYQIKYRLYELENLLPWYFMRVSKSTILNINKIFAIDKNIYSSSTVSFRNSHKQVFVSRHYYKALIEKLDEKRVFE